MITLLVLLTAAPAQEEARYDADPVVVRARAPVFGIEVPRPKAHLDWFEGDDIHGDGWTVDLWFVATGSDGTPVKGLELYLSASTGDLGPLVEHGEGLYSMAYTPPEVEHWTELILHAKGITGHQDGIHVEHSRWIYPAVGRRGVARERQRPAAPEPSNPPTVSR